MRETKSKRWCLTKGHLQNPINNANFAKITGHIILIRLIIYMYHAVISFLNLKQYQRECTINPIAIGISMYRNIKNRSNPCPPEKSSMQFNNIYNKNIVNDAITSP